MSLFLSASFENCNGFDASIFSYFLFLHINLNLQQNFKDSTANDASLMQTEAVVLLIEAILHDGSRVPLYCNEARNSEQSARPLQMVFEKETTATNEAEGKRLMKEMNDLQATPYIPKKFPNLSIKFKGYLTMVDGKVVFDDLNCRSLFLLNKQLKH